MKVLYPITLDVKKTNVQKIIPANQGEGLDRKLIITLVSGSENIILDSDNQSAQFVATKPDGTHIYNHAQIHDGKIIVYLTTQVVAAVGNVDCQIRVISGDEGNVADGNIYSAKFSIDVEAPLYSDEEIQSTNEFSELVELTQKVTKQVTVFTGEGVPDTDPATYEDVKVSDFYYDSTNRTYYYATTVTVSTIRWQNIIDKNALDTALALKQDKLSVQGHSTLSSATLINNASKIYLLEDDEPSTDTSDYDEVPQEEDIAICVTTATIGTNARMWICANVIGSNIEWKEMLFHDMVLHTGTSAPPTTMNVSHYPYSEGDFYRRTVTDGYELYYLEKIDLTSGSGSSAVWTLTWLNLSDKYTKSEVDAKLALKQNAFSAGDGIKLLNAVLSLLLDDNSANLLSFNNDGELTLLGSTVGIDANFREALLSTMPIGWKNIQEKLVPGANITIGSDGKTISASASTRFEVVETLPVSDIRTDTIYLVPKEDPETGDYFDEYAYINGQWELLGTTKIDLSNYVTNAALAAALLNYQLKIDSSHKLDADLIEDGEVNKTVTAQEKSVWNSSHNVIIDSASGSNITLPDSTDNPFNQIFINGKSTQAGTPTIDNPIPITDTTAEEIEVTDGTNTQTAEIDITLRGIPVASDGNYTDANNQQWICDTIERYADGTGKYIQRVTTKVLDGTETWTDSTNNRVFTRLTRIPSSTQASPKTIFTHCSLSSNVGVNDNTYTHTGGNFMCSPTHNGTRLTASQWATFLETSNATIYYPLDTPVETPLTAEQIAELNLDAYYPETQITSTPDITVYYICDLKNYIDKKTS